MPPVYNKITNEIFSINQKSLNVSVTGTDISSVLLWNSVNSIEICSGRKLETDKKSNVFMNPTNKTPVEIKEVHRSLLPPPRHGEPQGKEGEKMESNIPHPKR
jgi:hypothetical protein